MDLELTDEQNWLSESIETLLAREWPGAEADTADRDRLWQRLAEFGALSVDREDGLGAVELCLAARAMGARLASVPYVGSAAARFAAEPLLGELPSAFGELATSADRVAVALLEPGGRWSSAAVRASVGPDGLSGRKVAVEHADAVDRFAVVAEIGGEPGLVLVPAEAAGIEITPQPGLDAGVPLSAVSFDAVAVAAEATAEGEAGRRLLARLMTVGGLLAAAESVGAAGRLLEDARVYAGERRQFGRTIGSNQALRHLMADMYVRQTSSWSTVLYAAAALDDDLDFAEETAAVAKAYVARSAREVAHGALQVFGGIAFTEEHAAHRFLRRIVVREQQFGDAAHHERELGRALAARARGHRPVSTSPAPVS